MGPFYERYQENLALASGLKTVGNRLPVSSHILPVVRPPEKMSVTPATTESIPGLIFAVRRHFVQWNSRYKSPLDIRVTGNASSGKDDSATLEFIAVTGQAAMSATAYPITSLAFLFAVIDQ